MSRHYTVVVADAVTDMDWIAFFADPDDEPHRSKRLANTTGVNYLVAGLDQD